MGKRSFGQFERRERDFYPTPFKAVPPLIPHLRGIRRFAEPCCGDGALVRHLESFGLRCGYAADIATGQDAFALNTYGTVDAIITNPPYGDPDKPKSRKQLHRLITHFQNIAPTWLLLELDWAATKQAHPYLVSCSDIVAFGRLKLVAKTKNSGMQNFAWYRFDARHTAGPIFHSFRSAPAGSHAAPCRQCGRPYRPQRSTSKFCSDTCRQRAHRGLSVTWRDTTRPPLREATPASSEPDGGIPDFLRRRRRREEAAP